jgi:CheY-like chemotaxis protein
MQKIAPTSKGMGSVHAQNRFRSFSSVHGTPSSATLLWIDDYKPGLLVYRAMFESFGFRVLTASSGGDAIKILEYASVDLVVTDYEMPDMDGEAVALAMRALAPDIPVLLFSGSTTVPQRVRKIVDACCDKAESREKLLAVIHYLLQRKRPAALQPPPVTLASDHGRRSVA